MIRIPGGNAPSPGSWAGAHPAASLCARMAASAASTSATFHVADAPTGESITETFTPGRYGSSGGYDEGRSAAATKKETTNDRTGSSAPDVSMRRSTPGRGA
jgi:hypothetical protein